MYALARSATSSTHFTQASNFGVFAQAWGYHPSTNHWTSNDAIFGSAQSPNNGFSPNWVGNTNWAGYFSGAVYTSEPAYSTSDSIFKINVDTIPNALSIINPVSYTHLRAHETGRNLVCRL